MHGFMRQRGSSWELRVPAPDINPPAPRDLARVFALATEWDVEFADSSSSPQPRALGEASWSRPAGPTLTSTEAASPSVAG